MNLQMDLTWDEGKKEKVELLESMIYILSTLIRSLHLQTPVW